MTPADSLWEYANRLYAAPGVSDACLRLQDECDVDVCVLMLLLWLAQQRRAMRDTQVQMILRSSAEWREQVVQPLRGVRRRLKAPPTLIDAADSEALRQAIKAAELRAERLELNALQSLFGESRLCDSATDADAAARNNIGSYAAAVSAAFAPQAVDVLLAGFREIMHE